MDKFVLNHSSVTIIKFYILLRRSSIKQFLRAPAWLSFAICCRIIFFLGSEKRISHRRTMAARIWAILHFFVTDKKEYNIDSVFAPLTIVGRNQGLDGGDLNIGAGKKKEP